MPNPKSTSASGRLRRDALRARLVDALTRLSAEHEARVPESALAEVLGMSVATLRLYCDAFADEEGLVAYYSSGPRRGRRLYVLVPVEHRETKAERTARARRERDECLDLAGRLDVAFRKAGAIDDAEIRPDIDHVVIQLPLVGLRTLVALLERNPYEGALSYSEMMPLQFPPKGTP